MSSIILDPKKFRLKTFAIHATQVPYQSARQRLHLVLTLRLGWPLRLYPYRRKRLLPNSIRTEQCRTMETVVTQGKLHLSHRRKKGLSKRFNQNIVVKCT